MRKFTIAVVLVAAFTVGVLAGLTPRSANAGKCWTTECSNGEALYCCRTNGKLLCKVVLCG